MDGVDGSFETLNVTISDAMSIAVTIKEQSIVCTVYMRREGEGERERRERERERERKKWNNNIITIIITGANTFV